VLIPAPGKFRLLLAPLGGSFACARSATPSSFRHPALVLFAVSSAYAQGAEYPDRVQVGGADSRAVTEASGLTGTVRPLRYLSFRRCAARRACWPHSSPSSEGFQAPSMSAAALTRRNACTSFRPTIAMQEVEGHCQQDTGDLVTEAGAEVARTGTKAKRQVAALASQPIRHAPLKRSSYVSGFEHSGDGHSQAAALERAMRLSE